MNRSLGCSQPMRSGVVNGQHAVTHRLIFASKLTPWKAHCYCSRAQSQKHRVGRRLRLNSSWCWKLSRHFLPYRLAGSGISLHDIVRTSSGSISGSLQLPTAQWQAPVN